MRTRVRLDGVSPNSLSICHAARREPVALICMIPQDHPGQQMLFGG